MKNGTYRQFSYKHLLKRQFLLSILTGLSVLFGYNNCAEKSFDFGITKEAAERALNSGGILIEDGAEFTRNQKVMVRLNTEPSNEMYVTNDSTCQSGGSWQPYSNLIEWELSKTNANVAVHVQYKDGDGVLSACLSDDIVHDDISPTLRFESTPGAMSNKAKAQFVIIGTDNLSGMDHYLCSDEATGPFEKCSYLKERNLSQQGQYKFFVKGLDRAGNISDTISHVWVFDHEAPVIEIKSRPATLTGDGNATFNVVATDNLTSVSKLTCRVDNGAEIDCKDKAFNVSNLSDGAHIFKTIAIDGAGNKSEATYQWSIDSKAPNVRIVQAPPVFSKEPNAVFGFVADDDFSGVVSFRCSLDGSSYSACTSPKSYTNLIEGPHKFSVIGVDQVGNQSAPAEHTWTVDWTAPSLTILTGPDVYTRSTSANFTLDAKDFGSGIKTISCAVDGVSVDCQGQVANVQNLNEGQHTFTAEATDNAGNKSGVKTYTWTIDKTPPTVRIVTAPDSLTADQIAVFGFEGTDDRSGIAGYFCRLDTGAYVSCNSPHEIKNLMEGPHIFSVYAEDRAGNQSASDSYSWKIDITGPAITFLNFPIEQGENDSAKVTFRVSDADASVQSVECGVAGQLRPCVFPEYTDNFAPFSLNPGTVTYTVRAIDSLGNMSAASVNWKVVSTLNAVSQNVDIALNRKVDILIVVDNSGSMSEEQNSMKARIGNFISKISELDWQIGVTSTDSRDNRINGDGKIVKFSNGQYVLNSTVNDVFAQEMLGNAVAMGANGSGSEQGIRATYRFITRSLSSNSPESELLRPDAAFAVVLISDTDETFSGSGTVMNKPDSLLEFVQGTFGTEKIFVFNSIIALVENNDRCMEYWPNTPGLAYKRLSDLTEGVIGSVCASDYGTQLSDIGSTVAGLVRSVNLTCAPVDADQNGSPDFEVFYRDGTPATIPAYMISGKLVTFAEALPEGQYTFKYTCLQ